MASLEYTVTQQPENPARLGTDQIQELGIISNLVVTINANRSVANSMDQLSHRGTFISAHDTVSFTLTFSELERPFYREMIYSLMNYQRSEFDALDIPQIAARRDFVLLDSNWPVERFGCKYYQVTLNGKLYP